MSGDGSETLCYNLWGEVLRLHHWWKTPRLGASNFVSVFLKFLLLSISNPIVFVLAAKKRPPLKSRYKGRVQAATKYAKTIKDFDDLVDPLTLACHFLGSKPSSFVMQAIQIEEKSKSV